MTERHYRKNKSFPGLRHMVVKIKKEPSYVAKNSFASSLASVKNVVYKSTSTW